MNDSVSMMVAKREFDQFFKKKETMIFLSMNTLFMVFVLSLSSDDKYGAYLVSINTSLWAAVFFYFLFNVYGNIEIKVNRLLSFKGALKQKISYFERSYQKFIDEAVENGLTDQQGMTSFFAYVETLPIGHIPKTSKLRMLKSSKIVDAKVEYFFYDIVHCCMYEFDKNKTGLEELERLALSLQLRELDPEMYERIYQLIKTKPIARNQLQSGTPFANPHVALAGDLDLMKSNLVYLTDYLNKEWALEITI